MNFFEHQEKARKQSLWIIIAFIFVTLLIVMAVNLIVMLVLFTTQSMDSVGAVNFSQQGVAALLDPQVWTANYQMLAICSVVTGGVIGISSLGKVASLRSGGGKVARDMGATIVTPDTRDPLRRRLYNVVEEIALASGAPVPEVFVMEMSQALTLLRRAILQQMQQSLLLKVPLRNLTVVNYEALLRMNLVTYSMVICALIFV